MIMLKQIMIAVSLFTITASALAIPIELACTWKNAEFVSSDPGAKEAAKFYSRPDELVYFQLNAESKNVKNSDPHNTQEIIFSSLSLHVFPERFRIVANEPNMANLKGRKAQIHIDINRYSLKSTMILEMTEKGSGRPVAFWLREGQCFKKTF